MNLPATLARLGPWLVALAPAWFVYDSLVTKLGVPNYVAIPIAAGVELTGVAAFDTWLWLLAWNRKKRKSTPQPRSNWPYCQLPYIWLPASLSPRY